MNSCNTVYSKCYVAHNKFLRLKLSADSKRLKIVRAIKTVQVNISVGSLTGIYAVFKCSSLYRYFLIPHSYLGYGFKKENKIYIHKKSNRYK